jgi:uncharacterized protein YqhQ
MRCGSGNSCTGEDLDGPKTVEEKVSRLAKVRLLKQFSFGVIAYVLATALVVLLPIFVSPEVHVRHNECRAPPRMQMPALVQSGKSCAHP